MPIHLVQVGFDNTVVVEKILTICPTDTAPVSRAVREYMAVGQVTDLTAGRAAKSAIYLTSGKIVLSALTPDTIKGRIDALA